VARLEERVAAVESTVQEHAAMMAGIREAVVGLDARVTSLDARMVGFEARIDRRLDSMEQRMDRRFESMDGRIDAIDAKMSRQFMWMVGLQVTTLVTVVIALAAR
jgi:hypothetical protein